MSNDSTKMSQIESVDVRGVTLTVIERNGQRVVTLAMMDAVHQRPEGTARRTFNTHRERLIEGEDFITLEQANEIRTVGLARADGSTPASVTLLTESGYSMLVKSFTDDLAWEVQRKLVNNYFRKPAPAVLEAAKPPMKSSRSIRSEQGDKVRLLMQVGRFMSKMPGVNAGIAAACTARAITIETGLDVSGYFAPALPAAEGPLPGMNATQLGERVGLSARALNNQLCLLGWQTKLPRGGFDLTDVGLQYGERLPFNRHGHSGWQIQWKDTAEEAFRKATQGTTQEEQEPQTPVGDLFGGAGGAA